MAKANWRTLPRVPGGGRKPKWGNLGAMVRINARWPREVKIAMVEKYGSEQAAIDELIIKRSTEVDRTQQVNWINELAANIAENLGEGTAAELVEYALSAEGRESWGIELPEWFDAHDRGLLIQAVKRGLAA